MRSTPPAPGTGTARASRGSGSRRFAVPRPAAGEVVEILEREGRRELRVLLSAGTVLTVVADGWEGHLGDSFVFGGAVRLEGGNPGPGERRNGPCGWQRERRTG